MSNEPTDQEVGDMYARVASVVWENLPAAARQSISRDLDPDTRNEVAKTLRHGRKLRRG